MCKYIIFSKITLFAARISLTAKKVISPQYSTFLLILRLSCNKKLSIVSENTIQCVFNQISSHKNVGGGGANGEIELFKIEFNFPEDD